MTAADRAPPAAGAGDLDEFRLLRPLGKGGMGAVYLGHDTVLDRLVAIKLIGARDPDLSSRERFLIEARAVARLSHPNVVAIHRVGTTPDGRPYLVQELIRGTSLDRAPRPLPWRRVAEIGAGIARGLAAAHRRGILHRDVKPGNVMLDEAGVARLLDFGLAKLSGDDGAAALMREAAEARAITQDSVDVTADTPAAGSGEWEALSPPRFTSTPTSESEGMGTAPGALIGTPRYAAPEIWRGDAATARSDLYSLGALLYELLAGHAPHPERDLVQLRDAIATDPRPVADLVPDAPPPLCALVDRCLARAPAQRPESADEVAHALDQLLVAPSALPEGNPYRGLRAFDADHRALFFGRGADIGALVDRLRTEPLVAVVADSGIGKSSVCRAGVLPAIVGGALADRRAWRAVTAIPGRRPFAALCDALAVPADRRGDPATDIVRQLRPAPTEGVVLFVDQLEELITLAEPVEAERAAELIAAIGDGVLGVKALLAVRSDFLTRVAALSSLGPPLTRGLQLLRALTAADLREAVVGPARAQGLRFETEAMVTELVDAVTHTAGALPLLQFALAALWTARDVERACLPVAALEQLGGVAGGLAGHADAVVQALGTAERAAARRILVRLVTAAGTRAVREPAELGADDAIASAALEALVRGRLVVARDTADGAPAYELAHEALIAGWGRLRSWLDDDAGRRAVRERLAAAAASWQRLGRRGDLLWGASQLAEARGLDDVSGLEAEFLAASRRHRRQRQLAVGAVALAIPMVALATWLGVRAQDAAERASAIEHRAATAEAHRHRGDQRATTAAAQRQAALALFGTGDPGAEAAWDLARRTAREARDAYRDAAAQLETALQLAGGRADLRAGMADVILDHARVAEAERDVDGVAELVRRLETYDAARVAQVWRRPAPLAVTARGRLEVRAYIDDGGRRRPGPPLAAATDRLSLSLPPGSYLVTLATPDGLDVRYPVLLTRGEPTTIELAPPPRASIPDGYIYVPAGAFLAGSDHEDFLRRDFLRAVPLHPASTEAFLIARHEVTLADWMAYLRALPLAERATRLPEAQGGSVMVMRLIADGEHFTYLLQPSTVAYRAAEDEPLVYRDRDRRQRVRWQRLPVSAISWDDARAYASWLAVTNRVPGARLCTELEWERAARGADGRPFPHGDILAPDDANIDTTYGRRPLAFGPDEVGAHPASTSPFGVTDMAGNVFEWVAGDGETPVIRGGAWYYGPSSALTTNRGRSERSMRNIVTGIRLCADAPPAR